MEKGGILITTFMVVIIIFVLVAALIERCGASKERWGASKERCGASKERCGASKQGSASKQGGASKEPGGIRWDGPAACHSKEMVAACQSFMKNLVRQSRRFGPATREEAEQIADLAAKFSREYGIELRASQLAAVRDMEISFEARRGGVRALRHGPELFTASRRGDPILTIAEKFHLPPMAVLRQVMLEEGFTPAEVRAAIADPAHRRMPPRLAREAAAVFEADLGSKLNAERIRARAQAFEDAVGAHLAHLGLQFRTEMDLRLHGLHGHGREAEASAGVLTPDFLLDEPAEINGSTVCWVDAKNYPMYGSPLVMQSLRSQAAKYTKAFGPGAMVFNGGVMCGAQALFGSDSPLLLDAPHIAPF